MIRPKLQELFQHHGHSMEEPLQQEKQEPEYKDPNEEQGGIRRRLRDRDLLRKRKAEAEEKETNQEESPRKRRAVDRSSAKKKGRPRKTEPTAELFVLQEEASTPQGAPAVVVVSEPAEIIPDQTLSTLVAVESQLAPVVTAPPPVFGSVQIPVFLPSPAPPDSANPTQALLSPSAPAPAPIKDLDVAPIPVQDLALAPVPFLTQAPVPAAPPTAPSQVGALSEETKDRKDLNQVTVEDLCPDEKEDSSLSTDKRTDEDLSGTPLVNVPEQNRMFSVPTLSSQPPPQEDLPGNPF